MTSPDVWRSCLTTPHRPSMLCSTRGKTCSEVHIEVRRPSKTLLRGQATPPQQAPPVVGLTPRSHRHSRVMGLPPTSTGEFAVDAGADVKGAITRLDPADVWVGITLEEQLVYTIGEGQGKGRSPTYLAA